MSTLHQLVNSSRESFMLSALLQCIFYTSFPKAPCESLQELCWQCLVHNMFICSISVICHLLVSEHSRVMKFTSVFSCICLHNMRCNLCIWNFSWTCTCFQTMTIYWLRHSFLRPVSQQIYKFRDIFPFTCFIAYCRYPFVPISFHLV